MTKFLLSLVPALLLLVDGLGAKERYVYKTRVLLVAKAKTIINVDDIQKNSKQLKSISSNSRVKLFGREIINLDFRSVNNTENFVPINNIECYQDKKHTQDPAKQNCRSVQFLERGEYLYLRHRQLQTELIPLDRSTIGVEEFNVLDAHPDFDPDNDVVYDLAAIALLMKYLDLGPENPAKELFVAVNKSIAKIEVSYVKNIGSNKISIKLTPLRPGPDEFEEPFPHKIVYDKSLRVVTEIHQDLPVVGNTVIRLSRKDSSF